MRPIDGDRLSACIRGAFSFAYEQTKNTRNDIVTRHNISIIKGVVEEVLDAIDKLPEVSNGE